MVSYTDYRDKINGHAVDTANGHAVEEVPVPRQRPRFRLLAALAAPFRDIDERAIRRKGKDARNKIIGAPFANHEPTARTKIPVKPFPSGGD